MEARLTNSSETEFKTALQETSNIARLRLTGIIV
jgi:2-oxo-4-hydroxy-4-carboxy--5-ureidoimidazoline (OHCU) decarboxylase